MSSTEPAVASPVRVSFEREGALVRLVLDRPKGNVLDLEMIRALAETIAGLRKKHGVKLLVFEGAGKHFSFGASVAEHLPGEIGRVLPAFHHLFRVIEEAEIPTAALVRGQCLGGALELASACGFVRCDATARFGVPEITLGVFPPVAALTLPWRCGGARATELMLTGRSLGADEAVRIGLADRLVEDCEAGLGAFFDEHLAPKSALTLSYAWRAARRPLARAFEVELPELERLYLSDLMTNRDPVEGITAFVEKRPPAWSHN
jgi:cyclohexa-1,5-dienecarbonyl-CoA hydratase